MSKIYGYQAEIDNMMNKLAVIAESTSVFKEILKIQAAINLQEERDK